MPRTRRSHEEIHANFQSNAKLVVTSLSADVLINVITFLPPCDIISVRQTCKTLFSITKLRTVWMNALRGLMQDHFITEDTFPLETMSLPMLEHSALSPHRFVLLMEQSDNGKLQPTSTRVLTPRLTNQEKAVHRISSGGNLKAMILAPGGRYLATFAHCEENSSLFTIWDLGLSGNDGIKALTRLVQPGMDELSLIKFFPDLKKCGIFYLVTLQDTYSTQGVIVDVHTITINSSSPKFVSVSKIEVPTSAPTDLPDVFVSPGLCRVTIRTCISNQYSFLIWDFMNNTAATWIAPDCQHKPELGVYSYHHVLVVGVKDRLLIYNIPPFLPYNANTAARPLQASLRLLTDASPTTDSIYLGHNGCPLSDGPHYICSANADRIIIHEVKSISSAGDSTIPNKLPIFAGSVRVTHPSFRTGNSDCFTDIEQSAGHLFFGCYDSPTLTLFMLKVADQPNRDPILTKASLVCPNAIGLQQQFCLSMGRICFVPRFNEELHISDYLVPPD